VVKWSLLDVVWLQTIDVRKPNFMFKEVNHG
jgi:hypothetical protein